ncbi:MAG: hypothetical protein QM571_01005, partial [Micrococcaceae bacterium]
MVDGNSNFYDDVSDKQGVSRRTVAKGALWSVPVVSAAVTVPAFAASPLACDVSTIEFVHDENGVTAEALPYIHGKGSEFPSDVTLSIQEGGVPVPSGTVTLTITGDATFADDSQVKTGVPFTVGILTFGTTDSTSGLVVKTNTVLSSTGISVDASDDIKNFTITAVLDGCDSVTAEQVWIYPNLMTVGN